VEANDTVEQEAVRLHAAEAELPPITNLVPPPDVRSFRVYHYQGTYFVPSAREGWYPTNEKGASITSRKLTVSAPEGYERVTR
jgi:hypothetical protein